MSLLDRRVWGFRLVDLAALGLLIALVLTVYLAKTIAGKERAEIAMVERRIAGEHARIRLLQAEVAHLERPSRIQQLSVGHLNMAPLVAKQETTADRLNARIQAPEPPHKEPVT